MQELILALPFGVAVGLSLGLVGAGGSLLTVPILVYILDQPAREATTSTLVIVGLTAIAGLAGHVGRGVVRWRTALTFGGGSRARRPSQVISQRAGSTGR